MKARSPNADYSANSLSGRASEELSNVIHSDGFHAAGRASVFTVTVHFRSDSACMTIIEAAA